jgi:rod shape-determining protein MreC
MPLGTLDRTPPAFFRQGPSSLTKLVFFSALAVFLMVADTRFKFTAPLRNGMAVLLLPVERVLAVPVEVFENSGDYFTGLRSALAREAQAKTLLAAQAERVLRAEQLVQENTRLRALLELRPAITGRTLSAEVLYQAADPYSRKFIIDRGATQGVIAGSPVINEAGVLGQVTRVYPLTAEITLLGDKDAAIPVLNTRTQQRAVAFGGGAGGSMELRFTSANADVQAGDVLTTSGLDGVYPGGLPVAKVVNVQRRVETGFARIQLQPSAASDGVRHLLVLEPLNLQLPPRPAAAPEPAKGERQLNAPGRRVPASGSSSASGAAP